MTTIALPRINRALWAIPAGVLLAGVSIVGIRMMLPPPADLDLSRTQTSVNGAFVATIEPPAVIAIGEAQTWTIEVTMTNGSAVELADVSVDGAMPAHGHGLSSQPKVTRDLGDGRFTVEGVALSMAGWWVVSVHVATPAGPDQATFNFVL